MYRTRKGFTLAEVLLTLLIIGIIASIVIPGLINDTQDAQYKVAYKKAFAEAALATKNGIFQGLFITRNGSIDYNATTYNFNIFKNQFSVVKECIDNNNDQCWNLTGEKACDGTCGGGAPTYVSGAFIDNSGMAWSMYTTQEGMILVDTNGNKAPNKYGKDRWIFAFKDHDNNRITVGLPYKIGPYFNTDITSFNNMACHYPPCYYISWLEQ